MIREDYFKHAVKKELVHDGISHGLIAIPRLYPLKFNSITKEKIWGVERWGVSDHPNGKTTVSNGILEGMSLGELIESYGDLVLGRGMKDKQFPIMIKIIEAKDDLSLQVHPSDKFAFTHENGQRGKYEAWYVVAAEHGAKIVSGVKQTTPEQFRFYVERGLWNEIVEFRPVKEGDFYYLPAGTVHALLKGATVCEIQTTSDITYRIWDYDRADSDGNKRELHLDKALKVMNCYPNFHQTHFELIANQQGFARYGLVNSPYFKVEKLELRSRVVFDFEGKSYMLITCLEGHARIYSGMNLFNHVYFEKGDTVLVPAAAREFAINGNATCLITYAR